MCSEGGSFFGTAAVPSPGRLREIGCCNALVIPVFTTAPGLRVHLCARPRFLVRYQQPLATHQSCDRGQSELRLFAEQPSVSSVASSVLACGDVAEGESTRGGMNFSISDVEKQLVAVGTSALAD